MVLEAGGVEAAFERVADIPVADTSPTRPALAR